MCTGTRPSAAEVSTLARMRAAATPVPGWRCHREHWGGLSASLIAAVFLIRLFYLISHGHEECIDDLLVLGPASS